MAVQILYSVVGDSGEKKVDEHTPTSGSVAPPPGPGVGQPAPSKPTSLDTSSCRGEEMGRLLYSSQSAPYFDLSFKIRQKQLIYFIYFDI